MRRWRFQSPGSATTGDSGFSDKFWIGIALRRREPGPRGRGMPAPLSAHCFGGKSLTTAAVMARMPVAMLGPGSG